MEVYRSVVVDTDTVVKEGWTFNYNSTDANIKDCASREHNEQNTWDADSWLNTIKSLINLPRTTIDTVYIYSFSHSENSCNIHKLITSYFEEEKLPMDTNIKDRSRTRLEEETQKFSNHRVKFLYGAQSLFYELGKCMAKFISLIIYSDNPCFLEKEFTSHVSVGEPKVGESKLSQRKLSSLPKDLELYEKEGAEQRCSSQRNQGIMDSIDIKGIKQRELVTKEHIISSITTSSKDDLCTDLKDIQDATNEESKQDILHHDDFSEKSVSLELTESEVLEEEISEMTKITQKFENDPVHKHFLIQLLKEVPKCFDEKSESETIKYINALGSLIFQHLDKFLNTNKKKLSQKVKDIYFMYIKDLLIREKVTSGFLLESCATTSFKESLEQINKSNTVTLDFEKLSSVMDKLKPPKVKFSLKDHNLKGNSKLYSCICYTVIKNMLVNNFWKSGEPMSTARSLTNKIYKVVKDYYNSKNISAEEKALLKADSKIKYIIAEIFRLRGIWREENSIIIINPEMAESLLNEFTLQDLCTILNTLNNLIIQITS
ncbi:unnamed protein product [Moneuplotes crassus]|uniref:Uncharacterized protein n=1 Tax=Euplotes crassus TaxID=5936 RepID=A0AAD1Y8S8_EUPCR|nr:unnamed protein product [Moneuplotes crassus]